VGSLPQTLRVWVTSEQCPVLVKKGISVEKEGGGVGIHSDAIVIIVISVRSCFVFCYVNFPIAASFLDSFSSWLLVNTSLLYGLLPNTSGS